MGTKTKKTTLKRFAIPVAAVIASVCLVLQLSSVFHLSFLPKSNDVLACFGLSPYQSNDGSYVKMIDVGQGDGMLLKSNGQAAMIDFGDTADGGAAVVRALRKSGVKTINVALATHPHSDHIGGLPAVLKTFKVEHLVLPDLNTTDETSIDIASRVKKLIAKKKLKTEPPEIGKTYQVGDMKFSIIYFNSSFENENSRSIIVMVSCYGKRMLFTGDAEKECEADMLNKNLDLKADVLKVGHHGSKTSSSLEFLNAVQPTYAVISCGYDNIYFHPNDEVLKRLESRNIKMFRTDLSGDITIYFEKNKEMRILGEG